MKQRTLELITYAKVFASRADSDAHRDTDEARLLAVLGYHDACEFIVRGVIEEYSIAHTGDSLMKLIEDVNRYLNHAQSGSKLPLQSDIRSLNHSRNNAKHHAQSPSTTALRNHGTHYRQFAEIVCRDCLAADYSKITRSFLIRDESNRSRISQIEQTIENGEFRLALALSRWALELATPRTDSVLGRGRMRRLTPYRSNVRGSWPVYRSSGDTQALSEIVRATKALEAQTEAIGDLQAIVSDLRDEVAMLSSGADPRRVRRLLNLTPRVVTYIGGTSKAYWPSDQTASEQSALEALSLLIDTLLDWQDLGLLIIEPEHMWYEAGHRTEEVAIAWLSDAESSEISIS